MTRCSGSGARSGRGSRAGQGSRAAKYRQLVEETLGLSGDEVSVLCVLMLRGPADAG